MRSLSAWLKVRFSTPIHHELSWIQLATHWMR